MLSRISRQADSPPNGPQRWKYRGAISRAISINSRTLEWRTSPSPKRTALLLQRVTDDVSLGYGFNHPNGLGKVVRRVCHMSPSRRGKTDLVLRSSRETLHVRRESRCFSAGLVPPGNWFVPPGNNRSGGLGNEVVGAFDVKSRFKRLREHVGCNVSEHRVGLETPNAGADPPCRWGRPPLMEEYERTASIGPAGVLVTTCMHRKAYVTRETPAVTLEEQINRQLVRIRPGRLGWRRGP